MFTWHMAELNMVMFTVDMGAENAWNKLIAIKKWQGFSSQGKTSEASFVRFSEANQDMHCLG